MFKVEKKFPDFSLEVYRPVTDDIGRVTLKDFFGKSKTRFLIVFFYPADFTFVCPTELADLNQRYAEFRKLDVEILAVSTDTVFTHKAWLETEQILRGLRYPMAADHNGQLSRELGIYVEEKGLAQRAAFILDAKGIIQAVDVTADKIGRSAGEILRKVKALAFVSTHAGHVCPASWEEGQATLKPSIDMAGKVYQNWKND